MKATVTVQAADGRRRLPVLIGVADAAKVLGISRSSAYRAIEAGDLPVLRLAGRIYVPAARLLQLVGLDDGAAGQ
ncbi:MAG TPA: helix-turn-helix domain-containing protein [Actinomycetota bacterium]|jgi:excisionase family DNA binding protein